MIVLSIVNRNFNFFKEIAFGRMNVPLSSGTGAEGIQRSCLPRYLKYLQSTGHEKVPAVG
jgi:hypothetical protein